MKKEIALQLADALDSGDYIQGRYTNRSIDNKFCIGGVLINLFAIAHPSIAKRNKNPRHFEGCEATVPDCVIEWAGLYNENMSFRQHFYRRTARGTPITGLRDANDHGDTFKEMAAWLRTDNNYTLV